MIGLFQRQAARRRCPEAPGLRLKAEAGRGVYAAMLTAKGRMIADVRVFRRADGELLIGIAREALEGTREHLKKFVPPLFARWADVTDDVVEIGVYGPRSRELLGRALGAEIPELAEDAFVEPEWSGARLLVAATREAGGQEGFDVFVPAERAAELWTALRGRGMEIGARPVGFGALETLREEQESLFKFHLWMGRTLWGMFVRDDQIARTAAWMVRSNRYTPTSARSAASTSAGWPSTRRLSTLRRRNSTSRSRPAGGAVTGAPHPISSGPEPEPAEASPNDSGNYHVNRQCVDIRFRFSLFAIHVIEDLLCDQKTKSEKQSVPAKRERSDAKYLGTPVPNNEIQHSHKGKYKSKIPMSEAISGQNAKYWKTPKLKIIK